MIKSFRDPEAKRLWKEERTRRLPAQFRRVALKKLQMINAAGSLADLRVPSGNRLERLQGDREGQYSVRINNQYRVCFSWLDGNAYEVQITDYH